MVHRGQIRVLVAVLAVLAFPLASGRASAAVAYEATASAYGVDITIANPSIPLGLTVQLAGPAAQSKQSSLGDSDAFASFPYLGETVTGLPGLVNALFGAPLPAYPLYLSTGAGDEPAEQQVPGVTLRANSGNGLTEATAVAGSATPGVTSSTRIERKDDGAVLVVAETQMSALDLGGLATLDAIDAVATVELGADGTVERSSSISVGAITVPALNFRIPEATPSQIPIPIPIPGLPQPPPIDVPSLPLPFGGQILETPTFGFRDGYFTVQLPLNGGQEFAVPADTVLDALGAIGLNVQYQAAEEFTGANGELGVRAPALVFQTTLPALPSNDFFNGPTDVTYAIGRSMAAVSGSPTPTGGGVDVPMAPAPATELDVGGGGLSVPLPSTTGVDLPPQAVSTPVPSGISPSTATLPRATSISLDRDAQHLYLVLVGCGLGAFGLSQAIRLFGVRFPWIL